MIQRGSMRLGLLAGTAVVAIACDATVISGPGSGGAGSTATSVAVATSVSATSASTTSDASSSTASDVGSSTASGMACSMKGTQPGAPWPTQGQCTGRAGQSSAVASQTGALAWSLESPVDSFYAPVVGADDTIYAFGGNQELFAVTHDGVVSWTAPAPQCGFDPPTIGEDGALFAACGEYARAFEPDGAERWTKSHGTGGAASGLSVGEGVVYVAWGFGDAPAQVDAVAAADGFLLWSTELEGGYVLAPSVGADGTIYAVAPGANCCEDLVYALSPEGDILWTFRWMNIDSYIRSPPVVAPSGRIHVAATASLLAIDPDGTLAWSFPLPGTNDREPVVDANGTVYVLTDIEGMYAVNADGTLKWHYGPGLYSSGSPAIGGDGTLYFYSWIPERVAIALTSDGQFLWSSPIQDSSGWPAIGRNGELYIGGNRLFAFAP